MKNRNQILQVFVTLLILVAQVNTATGQGNYKLVQSSSYMKVSGTSTVHDWEMNVNTFNGAVSINEDGHTLNISKLFFLVQANSIKGDKNLMNKKTKEALKTDKHSRINFRFQEVSRLSTNSGNFSGRVAGQLTIAGKTRKVYIDFSGKRSGNKLYIKGTHTVDMTDYNIDPPTAAFGSIKTGKKVKISYNLTFKTNDS